MKALRIILFLVMVCLYLPDALSQNLVNNPSFETYNYNSSCGDNYFICQATNWNILLNTPDVLNPINASVPPLSLSRQPKTGDANARFAAPPNGMNEYFYGSTQALTAGQTYVVSFWVRKDYSTPENGSVGLHIGSSVPTSQVNAIIPQILVTPTSTEYVRGYTCYTASTSGVHYLTFGPFGGGNGVWLLDDVGVEVLDQTLPLPVAGLSIPQTTYCITDDIIANGSASANETSYQWDLYEIVNGNEVLEYSSGEMTGQAGQFSTANLTAFFPHDGECFRLYLSTFGVCKDRTSVDFCFVYPSIDFITDGSPVCENLPVNLQVTGDNGWTYTWSNASGQLASGTGLKTLSVMPTIGNSTYTVVVTTPQGCTSTETVTLTVNSQNNVAPWMDGINGTGEYTYYVSQGDAVFFNSVLSNDHLNEVMNIVPQTNVPSGFSVILPTISGSVFSFSWVTSSLIPTGEYYYTLTVDDQNACDPKTSVFKFRIIVVCDQCPVCVSYEDRTPTGTPLPAETKAGKCIEAGLTQTVSTGDANVLFQAGVYITEGPYFEAGPGYEGVIDPTTCITDCEDCCTDWAGFTYDEIPNPFIMIYGDTDSTNDFIQITDTYHPFCAFGAKGFKFEIVDGNQKLLNNVYPSIYNFPQCCPFESPAPENPIPHSAIWWDGYTKDVFGNVSRPHSGVFTYILTFYGCNGEELLLHGYIQYYRPGDGMIQNPNGQDSAQSALLNSSLTPEQQQEFEAFEKEREQLDKTLSLFPNPTTDLVQITGVESEDIYYQVFDEKGVLLSRKEKAVNQSFSLADYSKGTYYVRIYSGTAYVVRKVIKM
ncbi:hypothetical protein D3C71_502790 [compost metagenome]